MDPAQTLRPAAQSAALDAAAMKNVMVKTTKTMKRKPMKKVTTTAENLVNLRTDAHSTVAQATVRASQQK